MMKHNELIAKALHDRHVSDAGIPAEWDSMLEVGKDSWRKQARELLKLMPFDEIRELCKRDEINQFSGVSMVDLLRAKLDDILSLLSTEPEPDEPDSKRERIRKILCKHHPQIGKRNLKDVFDETLDNIMEVINK